MSEQLDDEELKKIIEDHDWWKEAFGDFIHGFTDRYSALVKMGNSYVEVDASAREWIMSNFDKKKESKT